MAESTPEHIDYPELPAALEVPSITTAREEAELLAAWRLTQLVNRAVREAVEPLGVLGFRPGKFRH